MNNSYSKSDRMIFLVLLSSLAGVAMMAFPMSGYVNASNVNASNVNASNTSGTSNPYATFMETPNMIAAGGPIPPNYTLVQQEANCIAEQKNPPWYPTMLGYERGDSNRTGLYACATFTGSFTEPNQVYAYKSPDKYYTPAVMVTRGTNEMYVYGGSNAARYSSSNCKLCQLVLNLVHSKSSGVPSLSIQTSPTSGPELVGSNHLEVTSLPLPTRTYTSLMPLLEKSKDS